MNRLAVVALVFALALPASADEVTLRSGQKLVGLAREDGDKIVIEMGSGSASFSRDEVMSITKGETPMHAYAAKLETIKDSKSAADYLDLAAFAKENKLSRYVGTLMSKVLELDPDNETARKELGQVKFDGKWMSPGEANKARGMIMFEGKWMFPLEIEVIKSKRLQEADKKLDSGKTEKKAAKEPVKQDAPAMLPLKQDEPKQEMPVAKKRDGDRDDVDVAKALPLGIPGAKDATERPLGLGAPSDRAHERPLGMGKAEYRIRRVPVFRFGCGDQWLDSYIVGRLVFGNWPNQWQPWGCTPCKPATKY